MSDINELLTATEGLSEDFKAQVPALFEEAVSAKVAEATKALQEEFDAKLTAALEEQKAESAKVLEEQKAEFVGQIEKLTEQVAASEAATAELKEEHADELFAIQEHIEEMVESSSEEKMVTLRENMDLYMDYVAREWVKEHQEAIIDQQKVALAEEFISAIQGVMKAHALAESDVAAELRDQLADAQAQVQSVTESMHSLLSEKAALEEKLNDAERIMTMEKLTEGMLDTDKAKVAELAKMIAEERDINVFTEKLQSIVETVSNEVAEESLEESAPVELAVTEGGVEEPKQETAQVWDPIAEMAKSMRHMYSPR